MAKLKSVSIHGVSDPVVKTKSKNAVYEVNYKQDPALKDIVFKYNKHITESKVAAKEAEELKPDLISIGQRAIFDHNASADKPASSVELVDSTGAAVRFTFMNKYAKTTRAVVESTFNAVKVNGKAVDVNDFFKEELVASFDAQSAFYDSKGNFNMKKYEAYRTAIETVAATFGDQSPLSLSKQIVPLDTFHEKRFQMFSPAVNENICAAIKNTVTLTPIVSITE